MFQIGTWNSLSFLNITDDNESLSQLNKTLKVLTVLVSAYTKNTVIPKIWIPRLFRERIPRLFIVKITEVILKKKTWVFLLKRGHS